MADQTDIVWDRTAEMPGLIQPQAIDRIHALLNPVEKPTVPYPGMVTVSPMTVAFLPLVNPDDKPVVDLSIPPIPRDGILYPQFVRKINEGTVPPS